MGAFDPSLRLRRAANADEFEELAGAFLRAHEAEHNLILGLCSGLRAMRAASATPTVDAPPTLPPYFAIVSSRDAVVGAAMRTPPYNTILSAMEDERTVDLVVDDLLRDAPDLTGVLGEKRLALRFAERWTAYTKRTHRLKTAERIFQLIRVILREPWVAGSGRQRETTSDWLPTGSRRSSAKRCARTAARPPRRRKSGSTRQAARCISGKTGRSCRCVAPADGRPTASGSAPCIRHQSCAAAAMRATASRARVGRSSTPGFRYVFLFTDLANPTSNHIYRAMGYEQVCDVDEYRFDDPSP